MAKSTLEMIQDIDKTKFPSNILKEYYDVIRELVGVIMILDGYKIIGENAHKEAFEYIQKNNSAYFKTHQLKLMDSLRILRNEISNDGFFIDTKYLIGVEKDVKEVIKILENLILKKLKST
jgi:hypothetical protein